jgi:hypothetical protein
MGRFLKECKLGMRKAMNMDGGYEADLVVNCAPVRYVTYGEWETQGANDISEPSGKIELPVFWGVSSRNKVT